MKKLLTLSLFLLSCCFLTSCGGPKPGVTGQVQVIKSDYDLILSVSRWDELSERLVSLAGKTNPGAGIMAAGALGPQSSFIPKDLVKDKPLGLFLNMQDANNPPAILAFLPYKGKDVATLKKQLASVAGAAFDVSITGGNAFIKSTAATIPEPKNPAKELGDLPARYLLAVQVRPTAFIQILREASDFNLALSPRNSMMQAKRDIHLSEMEDMETVLAGVNIAKDTCDITLDCTFLAKDGSMLAKDCTRGTNIRSKLGNLYDEKAALTFQLAGVVSGRDPFAKIMSDANGLPPAAAKFVAEIFSADAFDFAGAVYVRDYKTEGFIGVGINDAAKMRTILEEQATQGDTTIDFNVDKANGLDIHTGMTEGTSFALAIADDRMIVAFGQKSPIDALKQKLPEALKDKKAVHGFSMLVNAAMFRVGNDSAMLDNISGDMRFFGSYTNQGFTIQVKVASDFIAASQTAHLAAFSKLIEEDEADDDGENDEQSNDSFGDELFGDK